MKTGSDLIGDAHGPGRFWAITRNVYRKGKSSRGSGSTKTLRLLCASLHKNARRSADSQFYLMHVENQNMEIPGIAIGDAAAASLDAAAARREEERVYDTVLLSEMEYVEDDATYYYQCPCGDMFEITVEDLTNGMTIARCPSCSLKVRVDTPLPREGKRAGGAEGASSTT